MKQSFKCLIAVIAAIFMSVAAFAQVTTSSMSGQITDETGEPVVGVAVVATHTPSGTVYGAVTNGQGRYTIQGMRSGGPYQVEISCLGYQSVTYTEITLQLGETFSLNQPMKEDKEMLSEAVVISTPPSKFSARQTGAATNISNKQMQSLPTVSRSVTDIAKLSPYGGNGMSFSGANGKYSNFTVDGANFNNNFGLSENIPGGGSPISIDAIDEVQVVISPYDVRQTNFIGGGMNAVTKSGTNIFKGTAYVYHRNELMRGNTVEGVELGERAKDRTTTYGATLGGPIVKNKLFFFLNFEYTQSPTVVNRWRASEDGVADPDNFISRTLASDMEKVKTHLKEKYGYDTGSYTNFPANERNIKFLARVDWNITQAHHLAVRYNYTTNTSWTNPNRSSSNCILRTTQDRMGQYGMSFANSMYSQDNNVHSVSLDLNSRISESVSNQLLVTFSKLDDVRGSNSEKFPFIDILNGYDASAGTYDVSPYISAGYELFSLNNGVHNNVVTVKDDVTIYKGKHKIMAGINYEYQMADNVYMRNGTGYYRYSSLDDFLTGAAPETVAITYGFGGNKNPAARVSFNQLGLYAQEEWSPNEKFTLTAGLRFDTMLFNNSDLMTNNAILAYDYGGRNIDTGKWPSAKLLVSPRIGFTWDILGNNSLKLRGGTGIFAGRVPLVYFTNMPSNAGMYQNVVALSTSYDGPYKKEIHPLLEHFKGGLITDANEIVQKLHQLDPEKYPLEITPDKGSMPSQVQAVDPKFRMPQVWKSSIALDYSFPTPFPMSLSGEFIYNKTVAAVMLSNWNIKDSKGFAQYTGADNRHVYPDNYKYTDTDAYVLSNTHKGYGYTASATFNIQPIERLNISASYTHTVSKEISGMPGSNAESAFTNIPTIDGPNFIALHNSQFVTPDRFIASLTYSDKCDNHVSLFYEAWRGGANYSYMYDGDMNKDNYDYDIMYIPKDDSEIKFVSEDDRIRYWDYANNDKYLSKHKGEYAEAYSVYSPWTHRLDLRYWHDFKIKAGKQMNTIQLNVDFKNILNIFNSNWGVSKYMNPLLKDGRILKMERVENGAPVFSTNKNVQPGIEKWTRSHAIGQCWYVQVGIKYMFN